MQKIILASGSKQRKALLDALKIPFEVIPSDIDEKAITAFTQGERARLIALAKAQKVSSEYPEAIVIAGDTFTFFNGKAYEKPSDLEEAKVMLREQSGKQGTCFSGCAYLDPRNKIEFSTTAESTFIFRELSEAEIEKYVVNNPVLTWSAGFCPAYPEGINMIRAMAGSLSSFSHGLPMEIVVPLLEKSGIFDAES
ncbi:Maf family protein [Candidatus Woesebacteria bacterium]|nr:Maf family protein [Candidatus Woesebacteria bacterium]